MQKMNSRKTILIMALALVGSGAFAQDDQGNHGHNVKKEMGQKMNPVFKDEKVNYRPIWRINRLNVSANA